MQGDRTKNLATALKRLQAEYGEQITVEKVSRLYESAPQYVTDQPAFLNAAAEVKTTLSLSEEVAKIIYGLMKRQL